MPQLLQERFPCMFIAISRLQYAWPPSPLADPMESKRRRLSKLVSIPGITDSALASLLQALQGEPVPEASRRECNRAAFIEYDADLSMQLQLPLKDGSFFAWDICRPAALVQRSVRASPAMRRLFSRSASSPASPWHIALAHDEVTPGAVLRPHNKRKFTAFYMSFLQFGFAALRHDVCWLPVALIRSVVLDTAIGGLSSALRLLLRSMCLHDGGNFADGAILDLDDGADFSLRRVSHTSRR